MVRVFILAAGLGTRLFPFTSLLPKALMPVGSRPCIRWIVNRLLEQYFTDIVIRVNKRFLPMFKHEFRDLEEFVKFSAGDEPRGTAGELVEMHNDGLIDDTFIVYYADELTNINLRRLVDVHKETGAVVTLALVKSVQLDVGVVSLADKLADNVYEVGQFVEKPILDKATWAGICVCEPRILDHCDIDLDLAKDVFPDLLKRNRKVVALIFPEAHWLDIGTISMYRRAEEMWRKGEL